MMFLYAVKDDMTVTNVTKEDDEDRTERRWKIRRGDTSREKPKEEEDEQEQEQEVITHNHVVTATFFIACIIRFHTGETQCQHTGALYIIYYRQKVIS